MGRQGEFGAARAAFLRRCGHSFSLSYEALSALGSLNVFAKGAKVVGISLEGEKYDPATKLLHQLACAIVPRKRGSVPAACSACSHSSFSYMHARLLGCAL
ncbi:hypothetical protein KM043_008461 [Ampulex compressa]|nr:hypothetical protein KM043_008461 [Ampulex compressa]